MKYIFKILLLSIGLSISFAVFANTMPFGQRKDVQQFITTMVTHDHFDQQQLTELFNHVKLRKKIIYSINHPKESLPWYKYKKIFLNNERIEEGVQFRIKYADALEQAQKKYGVPPSLITAIIGIESNYGKQTGKYRVLDSLANLSFNHANRSNFFQYELKNFLILCRDKNVDPFSVYGSYAGAIGQPQFMPSTVRQYAVNFSRSGHIDLSHNEIDVIGSIANFFKSYGWQRDTPIMVRAKRKNHQSHPQFNALKPTTTIQKLPLFGIKPLEDLPQAKYIGLIRLEKQHGYEYWIALHNFFTITHYNTHFRYAIAAYSLSHAIDERYKKETR